jgi:hypothetical protein
MMSAVRISAPGGQDYLGKDKHPRALFVKPNVPPFLLQAIFGAGIRNPTAVSG